MNCKYSLLALSLVAAFSVMAEEVTLPSTGNEYNITDKDSYDNAEADYYYVKEKGSLNIKDGGYIHGNSLTMSDESMFRVENGGAAVFEGDINIDGLALNEKTVAGEGDRNLTGGGSLDVVGNITVNVYAGNGNSFQVGDKGKLTAGAVTVSNDGVAINNAGYIEIGLLNSSLTKIENKEGGTFTVNEIDGSLGNLTNSGSLYYGSSGDVLVIENGQTKLEAMNSGSIRSTDGGAIGLKVDGKFTNKSELQRKVPMTT